MGASSSTEGGGVNKDEQRDLETQITSCGALPFLQNSFSILSHSHSHSHSDSDSDSIPLSSLQECFSLKYGNISCEGGNLPEYFTGFLDQIGNSITDTLFVPEKGGLTWIEFMKGYMKCCGRMPISSQLNILLRVLALSAERAGYPFKLSFDSDEVNSKTNGSISPRELGMILWVCWIMSLNSRSLKTAEENEDLNLPNLNHLVLSAIVSCVDNSGDLNVWDIDPFTLEDELCAGKIHMWALRTVPNLADCFSHFINGRLKRAAALEGQPTNSTRNTSTSSKTAREPHLLTSGRGWAVSLSQRSSLSEEVLRICFPCDNDVIEQSLLYGSKVHGRGMNRFWSNVEGYHGPLLLLISAISGESNESTKKWVIGALTQQGFENRDVFYGSGGCLFSIDPVFNVFSASGREQNYVYSHLHAAVRVYEAHPKPVGLAFGGTFGNERIFIDEDFAKVTIRHHAVDKTYQHGSLFPNQGFLPTEASVLEVAVWGLGGKTAKEVQTLYQKREELFTEQRRTVDLKTFGDWEDSPEKMMMDMMANPSRVRREDR